VIIVRSADETGKRLAAHNDTNLLWCQVADFLHLQQPHFGFVTHAPHGARGRCLERF
jgi:hypothetical protein